MKNLLLASLFSFGLLGLNTACDPCTGCDPVTSEPTIQAAFFNGDSLQQVQDSVWIVDTLRVVVDSLLIVVDSIGKGGTLVSERQDLENYIDGLTNLRNSKTDSLVADCLDSLANVLNEQVSLLESGVTAVDLIELTNTSATDDSDSAAFHDLPLYLGGEVSNYELTIGNQSYSLDINYLLTDAINEDHRVIRSAFVESITASFDSLFCFCGADTVSCSTIECDAFSTSIDCYF